MSLEYLQICTNEYQISDDTKPLCSFSVFVLKEVQSAKVQSMLDDDAEFSDLNSDETL